MGIRYLLNLNYSTVVFQLVGRDTILGHVSFESGSQYVLKFKKKFISVLLHNVIKIKYYLEICKFLFIQL